MNFGVVALALFLVCGGALGIFAIASHGSSTPYVDTFGNTQTEATNRTQTEIINTAAAEGGLASGAVLIIAFLFVLVLVVFVVKAIHDTDRGYRSQRY